MSQFFKDIDTAHLSYPYSDKKFTISPAHLVRLAESCHYQLQGDLILFGIRASRAHSATGQWLSEITLSEGELDYEHFNCLLGIWDRQKSKIIAFEGSTVPYIDNLVKQQNDSSKQISNQLSQGLYNYFVGAHEPDNRPKEEGAFRLTRMIPVPVWRNYGNDTIVLDACFPNDHIHAAGSTDTKFKSAGCQVISGFHEGAMPSGDYQQFRIYAGLSALPSELDIQKPYQYMLVHSRHLFAIQSGWQEDRLLMGSKGMCVRNLQEALIEEKYLQETLIDKGLMDGRTVKAFYDRQKASNEFADGVYKFTCH